jgi:hypothetical protein
VPGKRPCTSVTRPARHTWPQLRIEHLTRLEAELAALQADLKKEQFARNEAAQLAAVLEARVDAGNDYVTIEIRYVML